MRRGLTLLLAAAALGAGCGTGEEPADVGPRGAAVLAAPAVALRADLGAALDARAWLTALAARTALISGPGSANAVAARRALDTATVSLAKRYREVSGKDALALLRTEDGLWARTARARAGTDTRARAAAATGLDANRGRLAGLLATDGLPAAEVERDLRRAQESLASALGSVATGSELAPERTATAATRATRIAPALGRAAKRRRPDLDGSPRSPAADLASLAATAFTDHTYAQAATDAVVAAGATRGSRLTAARRALGTSTETLAQLVAAVEGADAGERFQKLWTAHTESFVDYARAKDGGDVVGSTNALVALDRFRDGVVTLFGEVDADGPSRPLAAALDAHVEATTAVIRAQVANSPKVGVRLLEAAAASQRLGAVLAARFARQYPGRFPAV